MSNDPRSVIEELALEAGATREAIRKWWERPGGVPPRWQIRLFRLARERDRKLEFEDFEIAQKKAA